MALGIRFLLAPRQAVLGFGVAPDSFRALTEIKGVRDITSGVVPLVVWAAAGPAALGWVLVAAALTPAADATIVLSNGGRLSTAPGIHGLTAGLLVTSGLVLALGELHATDSPARSRTVPPRQEPRRTADLELEARPAPDLPVHLDDDEAGSRMTLWDPIAVGTVHLPHAPWRR